MAGLPARISLLWKWLPSATCLLEVTPAICIVHEKEQNVKLRGGKETDLLGSAYVSIIYQHSMGILLTDGCVDGVQGML